MNESGAVELVNPFPGLRPFREDEDHLFFGRESQVDTMVDKLARTRFLAVVGASGSGKSSLVNCGLRPALHRGLMASAGTAWCMVQFRPGNHPIRAMARALANEKILFGRYQAGAVSLVEIVEATLRMSKRGLQDVYDQAHLGEGIKLLLVVDQFEELFRFRRLEDPAASRDQGRSEEAAAFVNLLLEGQAQECVPIYVVLTMRSDFLGDCAQFPGLAEAINEGQYLVPRMTREERRAAIAGPVAVGGAEISPLLLTRLVNDVGDNPDQLSILQHALNRTWARWRHDGGPLSLPHYEAIGTMARALDRHAEKAYAELNSERQREICEKVFKALTDSGTDARGIRRPTRLSTLCALAQASPAEVTAVIDAFRKPSRSFLMPPIPEVLEPDTVIDISHESLMRVWERLKKWAEEEAQSAQRYRRLSQTAAEHLAGKAGLLRDPELQLSLDWHQRAKPDAAWASLYGGDLEAATRFLAESEADRENEKRQREEDRRRELEQAHALADEKARSARVFQVGFVVAAVLAIAAAGLGWSAVVQRRVAVRQGQVAVNQSRVAQARELLASANHALRFDPELGALLALEAHQRLRSSGTSDTSAAHQSLAVLSRAVSEMYGLSEATGPGKSAYLAAISPDGKLAATVDDSLALRIWDIATGHARAEVPPDGRAGQEGIASLAFSPDGNSVLSVTWGGMVSVWDSRGRLQRQIKLPVKSYRLRFSSDGRWLAEVQPDGALTKWDVANGRSQALGRVAADLEWVALDARTDRVVGAARDGTLRIWQVAPRKLIREIPSPAGPIDSASFSPDGRMLVTTSFDNTARIVEAETGRQLLSLLGHKSQVVGAAFLPGDKILATVSSDVVARTWSLGPLDPRTVKLNTAPGLEVAVFSADASLVATAGAASSRAQVWDVETRKPLWDPALSGVDHKDIINNFAFSANNELLITAGRDAVAKVWNARTGAHITDLDAQSGPLNSVAFSPDAGRAVSGGQDGTARVWNGENGTEIAKLGGHQGAVNSAEFSPDGKRIVTAGADGLVRIWGADDGEAAVSLVGHASGVMQGTFSPSGHRVMTVGEDETIRVWNADSGEVLAIARGSASKVLSLSYSADGRWFVSAFLDGTVNVGDTASGELLASLPGHTTWVNAAVFRPDSLTVRTISGDGTIRDIRCEVCLPEQDLLALARGKLVRIKREMSADERKVYVPAKP